MLVDSRLALSVRLVVECLQVVNDSGKLSGWTTKSDVVQAVLSDELTKDKINIVGVELEPKKKCMVSLFRDSDDSPLGQAIFSYEDDLEAKQDLELPMDYEEYAKNSPDEIDLVVARIADKLGLKVPVPSEQEQEQGSDREDEILQQQMAGQRTSSGTQSRRQPADMPGFEDEYQINEEGHGMRPDFPALERGYGDSDLYPTGEKYPNLADPTSTMRPLPSIPGRGGMTFDPLQEQARRRQEEEGKLRGPGWVPGAKFDDPYGHPGSGGGNFPGSSGMGFGGGGFI